MHSVLSLTQLLPHVAAIATCHRASNPMQNVHRLHVFIVRASQSCHPLMSSSPAGKGGGRKKSARMLQNNIACGSGFLANVLHAHTNQPQLTASCVGCATNGRWRVWTISAMATVTCKTMAARPGVRERRRDERVVCRIIRMRATPHTRRAQSVSLIIGFL